MASSGRVGSAGCSGVASDWVTSAASTLTAVFDLTELRAKTVCTASSWYASNLSLSLKNGVDMISWYKFPGMLLRNHPQLLSSIALSMLSHHLSPSLCNPTSLESLTRLAHFKSN